MDIAGAFQHVTSRGNRRQEIFRDERDYAAFLRYFAGAVERFGWRCHAYCLMPNHYHLLLETPEANLSRGMLVINGSYARYVNYRHKLTAGSSRGRTTPSPSRGTSISSSVSATSFRTRYEQLSAPTRQSGSGRATAQPRA